MYTRSLVGVDWIAISTDLMGLFFAVIWCGLVALAVVGFLLIISIVIRKAIKYFLEM